MKESIETNNLNGIGSNIWQLCKETNSIIQDNLCWVPSKGKNIDIWKYGIMGCASLDTKPTLKVIWNRLVHRGVKILYGIAYRNTYG